MVGKVRREVTLRDGRLTAAETKLLRRLATLRRGRAVDTLSCSAPTNSTATVRSLAVITTIASSSWPPSFDSPPS
jgi:hypothetical protein